MSNSHFINQLFKIENENLEISELLIEEEKYGSKTTDIAKLHFISTKTVEPVLSNFSSQAKPETS